jgi:hypothetical protein
VRSSPAFWHPPDSFGSSKRVKTLRAISRLQGRCINSSKLISPETFPVPCALYRRALAC